VPSCSEIQLTVLLPSVLSEEIETTMRNMGAKSLDELNPSFVNAKRLELELPDDLDFKFSQAALKAKL